MLVNDFSGSAKVSLSEDDVVLTVPSQKGMA